MSDDPPATPSPKPTPFSALEPLDPFAPENLRIEPSASEVGAARILVHLPVRKPHKQEYFRVRPGEEYRLVTAVLELKEERETYIITPALPAALAQETRSVTIHVCISRTGTLFLWPVPNPASDGRSNAWNETAREAAERAQKHWIRMIPNMGSGSYDLYPGRSDMADPIWPQESLRDLLSIAFGKGFLISSLDHPVIKRLQGL